MTVSWRVPGRIEVFGKHTDYAGGNVLVCAAGRGVTSEAVECDGEAVIARTDGFPDPVILQAGVDTNLPAGHWGRYLQTVVDRLARNFGPLRGTQLSFTSDLPMASGMSSSSALVVAAALALADVNGFRDTELWASELGDDRLRWALYLAAVENGKSFGSLAGHVGVGTLGGSEDHTAMLCGEPGKLSWFGFSPIGLRKQVPWPEGWSFVVATSGVAAEKTGAAQELYNRASLATAEALTRWNEATGRSDASLAAAVRSDEGAPARLLGLLPGGYLRDRVEQFVVESEKLVPQAAESMASGDLDGFADAASESMRLATTHLGNQVPQTVSLAESAVELGARASSSFGAGFGGSVWALVPTSQTDDFAADWMSRYEREYPLESERAYTVVTAPSQAATRIS